MGEKKLMLLDMIAHLQAIADQHGDIPVSLLFKYDTQNSEGDVEYHTVTETNVAASVRCHATVSMCTPGAKLTNSNDSQLILHHPNVKV